MRQVRATRALLGAYTALLVGAVLLLPLRAYSAAPGGITISPPLKELTLGPGLLVAKTNVALTNGTGQDLTASIRLVDFKALDQFGGVSLDQVGVPAAKYGLANWLSLPGGTSVLLPKGKTTTVSVEVQNRDDLAPGGHYGAAVVTANTAGNAAGSGNRVNLKQEVVSLLFVKKLGGEVYGLNLKSFKVDKSRSLPTMATLDFSGTGNVHVVPRGYINVTDPRGKLIAKGIINTESTLVLPGTSRQFNTPLQPVSIDNLSGRYQVTAYYRYDGKTNYDSKTLIINIGYETRVIVAALVLTGASLLLLLYLMLRHRQIWRFSRSKHRK